MKVGFFVPCYIDALAPQAAISSYKLLQRFPNVELHFIEQAACCALPLTDMGYSKKACALERNLVPLMSPYDFIVVPSGVCTDQFRFHFDSVPQTPVVRRLRESVYDVVEFLHDILEVKELPWAKFPHRVALHNGCHSLRYLHQARPTELMIPDFSKPAALLNMVKGLEVGYATRRDECCGFGGTFSMWDAPCAGQQGLDKVNDYVNNGFKYITSADYSCLLHQMTVARKHGIELKWYYIAEILNGDAQP
ncbi:MAG: (Fe-S)-binding protein [Firmicutes bacterium]|nr:(Fe-S)-binding protein [Bacillota bacterium]MCM1402072.1 (Fe-S)-binding protein [Bacteroides sp.]MCM1478002.1 (Fe-S)-binding protein [Bacteroides sp.]